jgi:UDP:flavonoid glycosyltransferase YjiC (YdhE family)
MIYYKPLVCFEDIESKISLYISHGGNGSIYQAMSQPVPLIVIPAFFEQEWNAHRVKKLNLGQVIFPGEMDDEIFTAIHRAISERVPEISETIQ